MMKKIHQISISLLSIVLITLLAGWFWFIHTNSAYGDSDRSRHVYDGETLSKMVLKMGKPNGEFEYTVHNIVDNTRYWLVHKYFSASEIADPTTKMKEVWWQDSNQMLIVFFKKHKDDWIVIESGQGPRLGSLKN